MCEGRSEPTSITEALAQDPDPFPDWLQNPPFEFNRLEFFNSRTVYYPGSGSDGYPVKACARAHAAHTFVYVDCGMSLETIRNHLCWVGDRGFRGYSVEYHEKVLESHLRPGGWTPHIDLRSGQHSCDRITPYALYVVLKRNDENNDSHGPKRLAILFIGGDGYATYDALYCQGDGTNSPYIVVVVDHGFGGDFISWFGAGGLLEEISYKCGVFPDKLIVGNNRDPWSGYVDSNAEPEKGGMHGDCRRLYYRITE